MATTLACPTTDMAVTGFAVCPLEDELGKRPTDPPGYSGNWCARDWGTSLPPTYAAVCWATGVFAIRKPVNLIVAEADRFLTQPPRPSSRFTREPAGGKPGEWLHAKSKYPSLGKQLPPNTYRCVAGYDMESDYIDGHWVYFGGTILASRTFTVGDAP